MADHFQYLAGIGLIALIVAGLAHLLGCKPAELQPEAPEKSPAESQIPETLSRQVTATMVVGSLAILVLAAISYVHAQAFANAAALWQDTIAKNPNSWMAKDNLAVELIKEAEQAIREAPKLAELGDRDSAQSNVDLANEDLDKARQLLLDSIDLHGRDSQLVALLADVYRVHAVFREAMPWINCGSARNSPRKPSPCKRR